MTTLNLNLDGKNDILSGKWKQMQGAVRERWGELSNDDLTRIAGKRDQFIGALQEKYGYTQEEAGRALEQFVTTYHDKLDELKDRQLDTRQEKSWVGIAAAVSIVGAVLMFLLLRNRA
jgi:uncharacterized protein YjbJ (UPF0337 family)